MGVGQLLKVASAIPNFKVMGTKYGAKEVVSILPIIPFTEIYKHEFSEIIDVRTPAEFEEDHVQGAINLPVLSNEQRAEVGTLYCSDKLRGRKVGAALIARNISDHILDHFKDKDLDYKPLVYCWRGGQRSRSMATILKEIGFQPHLMQAGYKAYRQHVCAYLCKEDSMDREETNLDRVHFIRISGVTGSGKTLLLKALRSRGEQILDLEDLAKHKGSILGDYPDEKQPSQKGFETLLFNQIEALRPGSVVWLENEGSKIGNIMVSRRVWEKMCRSPRIHITVALEDRVEYILKDYKYLIDSEKLDLPQLLKRLEKYAGKKSYTAWMKMREEGEFRSLVESLIQYYDASYKVPSGTPLSEFAVPPGVLLDEGRLADSSMVDDIIRLGKHYLEQNPVEKTEIKSEATDKDINQNSAEVTENRSEIRENGSAVHENGMDASDINYLSSAKGRKEEAGTVKKLVKSAA